MTSVALVMLLPVYGYCVRGGDGGNVNGFEKMQCSKFVMPSPLNLWCTVTV